MNIKRIVSAVILIPIVLLVTYFGSGNNYPWLFVAFIIIISTIAIMEGARIARKAGIKTQLVLLILANIAVQILMFYPAHRLKLSLVIFLFLILVFIAEMARGKPKGAISRIGANILILIMGCTFSIFTLLENVTYDSTTFIGHRLLMTLFAGVWAFDIFSYYGGKFAGKHKLTRHISPNKTWEGFIIGAIIGWVIFVIAGEFLIINSLDTYTLTSIGFSHLHLIIAGGVIILASLLGDLSESLLKRSANLKDSSKLIMGHGGILDRMDSLLFATPSFLFYLLLFLDSIIIA